MGAARDEDDLVSSHRTMAEGQRMAGLVSWAEDPATGRIVGAEALTELFDMPPEVAAAGPDAWLEVVHPDDRAGLLAEAFPARAEGRVAAYVVRIRDGDGWRWVRGQSRTAVVDGRLRRWGTLQDVTATRELERELEKQVILNVTGEAVASVANEAATLEEALVQLRGFMLADPAWDEVYAYRTSAEGLTPMQAPGVLPPQEPGEAEQALALAAWHADDVVWNPALTDVAFPLRLGEEAYAVVGLHSTVVSEQPELTTDVVRRAAAQLERVIERERAEAALAAARDQALAASRAKSDFLAVMSHEIRTPLNAVLGMAQLLGASDLDPDQASLVASVRDAGRTLLGLVDDVLDLSRAEAGNLELEEVDLDARAVVVGAADLLAAQARQRGITLTTHVAPEVPAALRGDPERLRQVVVNLVSNAVKFTAEGGVDIHVTAAPEGAGVRLVVAVRDTGSGVAPDALERLFETFTQADASTTRLHGGSGLGLSIARRLARAMGGDVTAVSSPGAGSTFTAEVVLAAAVSRPAVSPAAATPTVATGPAATARPDLPAAGPPRHVLVVEDNEINQVISRRMLELLGHTVEIAEDGVVALERFDPARHDLVLMDVQMPRLDGYGASRALRERHLGSRTPIVALTAGAVGGERERCLAAGMDDFLTKPADLSTLAATVARWTGGDQPPARNASIGAVPEGPAGAAVESTGPVEATDLDLTHLAELRLMDEAGWSYVDRAIANLSSGAPRSVHDARAALLAGEHERFEFIVHKLAGSLLNLGMREAGGLARAMRTDPPPDRCAALQRLLALDDAIDRGLRALQAWQTGTGTALAGGTAGETSRPG